MFDDISQHAFQPEEGTLRSYQGKTLSKQSSGVEIAKQYGSPYLVIHRADLLNCLVAKAKEMGVEIKFGAVVSSIDFEKGSINLLSGEEVAGDVIFGADGERSASRDALLGRPDIPHGTGDTVYRVAVKASSVRNQESLSQFLKTPSVNLWLGPDSHTVSYILKRQDILNIVLVCEDTANEEVMYGPQPADIHELKEMFKDWDPAFAALLQAENLMCMKWSLLEIDEVENWCNPAGKFALIGDAAHAMLPYL